MTTITKTSWQQHRQELQCIREDVFINEQHISAADEWDEEADDSATHYLAFENNAAIACARMIIHAGTGKIGRVAVIKAFRRRKIATQLLQFVIDDARTSRLHSLHLDAQLAALPLYEQLGFVAHGDTFLDAGIIHQGMSMILKGD